MKKEIMRFEFVKNKPDTFNHVVKANGFLFLSSQISANLTTGKVIPGDVAEQTVIAMDNVKKLIEACGGAMEDIVKVVIYMKDIKHRETINNVYRKYFESGKEPAKVSVQAQSPVPSVEVEIEAIAVAR